MSIVTENPHIHSYPSIYALGHSALEGMMDGPVLVEEKVDGSQFSFGVLVGEIVVRSKRKQMLIDAPEKMFTAAVETVRSIAPLLRPGWVYRGEFLRSPNHNTLAYERIPTNHLVLFDVCPGLETYLTAQEKADEAARLGLEVVPSFFHGIVSSTDQLSELLQTDSFLGGCKIEGVVLKRYDMFGMDKKVLMAKFVSENFKERHKVAWKESNPGRKDVVERLIVELATEARFAKAAQHLRDDGTLTGSPRDIGQLIKEVQADVSKEEHDYIAQELYKWAWPQIRGALTRGLPQWYKDELAKKAFGEETQ